MLQLVFWLLLHLAAAAGAAALHSRLSFTLILTNECCPTGVLLAPLQGPLSGGTLLTGLAGPSEQPQSPEQVLSHTALCVQQRDLQRARTIEHCWLCSSSSSCWLVTCGARRCSVGSASSTRRPG